MIDQREIPKQSPPPSKVPDDAFKLITEILFDVPDKLEDACDAVLIFGSSIPENNQRISSLMGLIYQKIGFKKVYIAGGVTVPDMPPESEQIHAVLAPQYPRVKFLLDRTSTNTMENVLNSITMGLNAHKNILFVAKAPHCGRCKLTLMRHLPKAIIRHQGYVPIVPRYDHDVEIGQRWHQSAVSASFVWAEFLRIETYGKRGDIAYPEDIKRKIRRVRKLVSNTPCSF